MKDITMDVFYDELVKVIDIVETTQHENLVKSGEIMADTIAKGGVVHVFGSGHSVGFGMEMRDKPGCLVPIHIIETNDFVVRGKTTLEDFKDPNDIFERRPGIADKMFDLYSVGEHDCFIIISNSGINGLVIDMAIKARETNHKVIVVTSWQHTSKEDSRHPSGMKLYQLGDVVIDNCGPQGDALIETGKVEKICSISSITGAFIAQSLTTETVRILMERNIEPPLFYASDVEGYEENNQRLHDLYDGRYN